MASGWAADGAENEQIEATINDAIDAPIPEARRLAMPGVHLCVRCQQSLEQHQQKVELFNRRGSKDSQLR